jgi:hypothetical protein
MPEGMQHLFVVCGATELSWQRLSAIEIFLCTVEHSGISFYVLQAMHCASALNLPQYISA